MKLKITIKISDFKKLLTYLSADFKWILQLQYIMILKKWSLKNETLKINLLCIESKNSEKLMSA